jgi:hypothetical protein
MLPETGSILFPSSRGSVDEPAMVMAGPSIEYDGDLISHGLKKDGMIFSKCSQRMIDTCANF